MGNITIPEWVRSAGLTFLTMFVITVLAEDFAWTWAALGAAVVAVLRTVLSGVLPGGSFGNSPALPPAE